MRKTLLQMYHDLKESNSTSDFPNLLANVMYKVLLDKFKGVNSPWREYTMRSPLSDFKTHNRVLVSEAPDLIEEAEGDDNEDSTLTDHNYGIALKTFKRSFTVTRNAIINDDLNALRRQPERFGRAAARTLIKRIVAAIEGSGNAYDGELFYQQNTGHNNALNTALTNDAAGIAEIASAMTKIEKATDPDTGEIMGIRPKYLIVCPELEDTAMRIVNGTAFIPVSTDGGTNEVGKAKRLQVLVEPFFTTTTRWMVAADPADAPGYEVGFLNGKETPDLLLRRADAINLAGGEDEWGYYFDDISYKVRFDFAIARAMYQGWVQGND